MAMSEIDGWTYYTRGMPPIGNDNRKIVTLRQDGMTWVGIRIFHAVENRWYNGNDAETAQVIAWQDLPNPARGFWDGGKLVVLRRGVLSDAQAAKGEKG
jgi:hypothetical protein